MNKLFCHTCDAQLIGVNDTLHNIITCPNCNYKIRVVGNML